MKFKSSKQYLTQYSTTWQHECLVWGLAHVSHREGPFVKLKSENQAFTEFKYPTIRHIVTAINGEDFDQL